MFEIGQHVICIDGSGWILQNEYTGFLFWCKPKKSVGPKKDEICLITDIHSKNGYLYIKGYEQHGHYTPKAFAPLADISELEEILKHEPQKQS